MVNMVSNKYVPLRHQLRHWPRTSQGGLGAQMAYGWQQFGQNFGGKVYDCVTLNLFPRRDQIQRARRRSLTPHSEYHGPITLQLCTATYHCHVRTALPCCKVVSTQLLFMVDPLTQCVGLREARGLQQGLKEALKTREPWDKEVEFQRKKWVH